MKSIKERDMELERLWEELEDVPMDPETECIEEAFYIWPTGTDREEIWHWFDERYSKGVPYLLYGDGSDCTDQIAKLVYLKQFCIECESQTCQFYHDGECRLALVCERKPVITEEDGCADYIFKKDEIQAFTPMEIPSALGVRTPLGELVVRAAADPEHPGFYIDLRRSDFDADMPVALVEFSADDSDFSEGDKHIVTRIWGDAKQEDCTSRVVHQNIENFFQMEGDKYK